MVPLPGIEERIDQARKTINANLEHIARRVVWLNVARERLAAKELRLIRQHDIAIRSIGDQSPE